MQQQGFTLLELLVVVAIVGILAAIGIPQYSEYKKRAFDSVALADLRNAALAEEAYFLDQEEYLSCRNDSCLSLPGMKRISKGVSLEIAGDANAFSGVASHERGSGKQYQWNSELGGLQ